MVTGGSVGIGLAVFKGIGKRRHGCCNFREKRRERAKTEAERIHHEFGVNSYGISCDVTKPQDIEQAMKEVLATIGTVDVLVNNAGTGSEETIMEATDEKWQYYWDLHVIALFVFQERVIP